MVTLIARLGHEAAGVGHYTKSVITSFFIQDLISLTNSTTLWVVNSKYFDPLLHVLPLPSLVSRRGASKQVQRFDILCVCQTVRQ